MDDELSAVTSSTLNISNSYIHDNYCYDDGGGFGSSGNSYCVFDNCKFENNIAEDNGGGLYLTLSSMELIRCLIISNISNGGAAGVDLWDAEAYVTKSVFDSNVSNYYTGGLSSFSNSLLLIK